MKIKHSRLLIVAIVPFLFVMFGVRPSAGVTNVTTSSFSAAPAVATGPLTQAYYILAVADRRYRGHRIQAMNQIAAAAKELGVTLQGNGVGKEQRVTSDQQLITVQHLLQQVEPGLPPKAKAHVDKALEALSAAMNVK
jgi:hypothetical protein